MKLCFEAIQSFFKDIAYFLTGRMFLTSFGVCTPFVFLSEMQLMAADILLVPTSLSNCSTSSLLRTSVLDV